MGSQERARRSAAIGAALAVLVSAGCGGPTAGWRFEGEPLRETADSLSTMTERWRSLMTSEDVEVSIPDDAGCYFQVADEERVGTDLLCGPLAFMGAEETQWTLAPLTALQGNDGVRLVLDDDTLFQFGTASPNSVPLDAEGNEADLEQQVEPPSAPPAELGEVIPLLPEEIEAIGDPYELVTVDATYTITTLGVKQQVGPPTDPTGAPEGGSLVTVGVERQAHRNVPTSPTSSAVLNVGESELEVPEETSAIAIEGDGADAVVSVEYDGNAQEYDLTTGELVSGRPFTARPFAPVNAPQRELIGNESEGASTSYEFRLKGGTASWSESTGWAPEGKDRLFLDLSFRSASTFREQHHKVDYREREYDFSALSVTADGEKIAVDPSAVEIAPRADNDYENLSMVAALVIDVPADAQEVTVSASVVAVSTVTQDEITNYQRKLTDGEPERIEETLELTEVTMQPE